MIPLLEHENARVQFFAAQALGRIKHEAAVQPLLQLIEKNADKDHYIRHAAVLALSRIGKTEPIIALSESPNKSLRIAAVLVLRRLQSEQVAKFLDDEDEYIVAEAARAINDDWSIEGALPALANTLTANRFSSEPLLRRAINAALRVGGEQELDHLIAFSKRNDIANGLRGEALAAIGTWGNPSVLDRVDGRYRGEIQRDANIVKNKIEKDISFFLNDSNQEILIGIIKTLSTLGIDSHNGTLFSLLSKHASEEVRGAALSALGDLNFENIETAMQLGMRDQNQDVRTVAVGLLGKMNISEAKLPAIVDPIFKSGSTREQQKILGVLGELPLEKSGSTLDELIGQAKRGRLDQGVILDLIEAVENTGSDTLIAQLETLKNTGQTVEAYKETLYGGQVRQGWSVFNDNPTAQCVRCHSLRGTGEKWVHHLTILPIY